MNSAGEEAEARIQEDSVDTVGIHIGDALVRIEPAGLAVLVRHRVGLDDALPGADPADPADADPAVADRMLLDDEPVLAAITFDDARRPIAELRVDVFGPKVERLEDMTVDIDDVMGAGHQRLL